MATALASMAEALPATPVTELPHLVREEAHIHKVACAVAIAAIEALGGNRSLQQLTRWLDRPTFDRLARRASLTARLSVAGYIRPVHAGANVKRSRVFRVEPGIYETAVIIVEEARARAIAMRIEQHRGMWKVKALDIA